MTYGVPYSFVPGTKAKADEVNANFIDVLNKIEDTNLRIDTTNETITTKNSELTSTINTKVTEVKQLANSRANLDLSNLSSTGKNVLNAKANAADIDGKWTYKYIVLISNVSFNGTSALSYSLSNYLPKDNNVYEVLINANISESGWKRLYISSDLEKSYVPICASNKFAASGSMLMPIGTGRKINISRSTSYGGVIDQLYISAYRKVR